MGYYFNSTIYTNQSKKQSLIQWVFCTLLQDIYIYDVYTNLFMMYINHEANFVEGNEVYIVLQCVKYRSNYIYKENIQLTNETKLIGANIFISM